MLTLTKIKNQFNGGHARTAKANKNIVFSFLIKGLSIACQFALVPMTIKYLDNSSYGIWQTIAQIVGWFSFFDIGVGNGLRNKLSEALAKGDAKLAKVYISTSYAWVAGIFLSLMVLFWIVSPFLNWAHLLGLAPSYAGILQRTMLVVFSFFCLQFILNLIGNVLFAHQEPALSNLISPLGNLLSLIVIFILTRTTSSGDLFTVSVVFSAAPVLVLLLFNLLFLGWKYRSIAPDIRFIRFSHSKDLFGLGVQFFIIQIAFIVMYSSANIMLIRWFGPNTVTVYTVAYKYFTIALLINGIITATYWSAFTDAYVRQEFDWVRYTVRRMEKVTYLLMAGVMLQTMLAGQLIHLWVRQVHVPLDMQITMCIFTLISLIAAPQHIFLNATGKIRLQLYTAVFTIFMTIPFAWLFCKVLHLGPKGVILAMICTSLPVTILYRIQYNKIMSGKSTGIWVK
ncbi:MAG TPA: MATE family efflux transporter [Puia sp.]|nr:MATE family efflux transporter [Puia sp.]